MTVSRLSGKKELNLLLDKRNERSSNPDKIDQLIKKKFEKDMAVMITDSVGFSKKTVDFGIIQYLAVLRKVNRTLKSIIKRHNGRILSEWADNFVIAFHEIIQAVTAAIDINTFLKAYNNKLPDDERFGICIGIGFGPVLYVGDDIYGHEVNCASKLGEDLAEEGDILITENANNALQKGLYTVHEIARIKISKISFKYYKVMY